MRILKTIKVVNKPVSAKRIWKLSLLLKHLALQSHTATQSLARGRVENIFATKGSAYLGPTVSASAWHRSPGPGLSATKCIDNPVASEPMCNSVAVDLRPFAPHSTNSPGVSGHSWIVDSIFWDTEEPGGQHQPNRLRTIKQWKVKTQELGWLRNGHHELLQFWAIPGSR